MYGGVGGGGMEGWAGGGSLVERWRDRGMEGWEVEGWRGGLVEG